MKPRPRSTPRTPAEIMADPMIMNPMREYLADRGWSQADMSRRLGVNYRELQQIFAGYRDCPAELIIKLSLELDLDPEDVPLRRWVADQALPRRVRQTHEGE